MEAPSKALTAAASSVDVSNPAATASLKVCLAAAYSTLASSKVSRASSNVSTASR